MHGANRNWLAHAQRSYGDRWVDRGVLEIGSLDINGEAREHVLGQPYIGVDIVGGEGVDLVCDARETSFDRRFACLVCTSVLEHTPVWREILGHNLQWLEPGGILLLGWGAEGNVRHDPEPWALVPVGDVLEFLAPRVEILEAYWEPGRFDGDAAPGFYDLIARTR